MEGHPAKLSYSMHVPWLQHAILQYNSIFVNSQVQIGVATGFEPRKRINCSYVPWNLHEPEKGVFDFGEGGRDFSAFLDLPGFIQMAREEDLFVIFRPGPYICAEWEFGGMPR